VRQVLAFLWIIGGAYNQLRMTSTEKNNGKYGEESVQEGRARRRGLKRKGFIYQNIGKERKTSRRKKEKKTGIHRPFCVALTGENPCQCQVWAKEASESNWGTESLSVAATISAYACEQKDVHKLRGLVGCTGNGTTGGKID